MLYDMRNLGHVNRAGYRAPVTKRQVKALRAVPETLHPFTEALGSPAEPLSALTQALCSLTEILGLPLDSRTKLLDSLT